MNSSSTGTPSAGPGDNSSINMTQSQRSLELRKFFEPFDPILSEIDGNGLNAAIYSDGALPAYAETVIWRLRGVRAMVTLIDRETQYFIAGAIRYGTVEHSKVVYDGKWFGCDTVPTPGGLCKNTMAVKRNMDDCSCFIVEDLQSDPRFSGLPVVDGSIAAYRFYAGTPITTENGTNIGSLFLFDDKPRPGGLTLEDRRFLFESASNVMKHFETKREAAERRRVVLMSRGIAQFLERTSQVVEGDVDMTSERGVLPPRPLRQSNSSPRISDRVAPSQGLSGDDVDEGSSEETAKSTSAKILDKIKSTLDHAANILRESLELTTGGVVFLDTALGYSDPGVESAYFDISVDVGGEDTENRSGGGNTPSDLTPNISAHALKSAYRRGGSFLRGGTSPNQVRGFNDQYRAAKVLAISTSDVARWDTSSTALDLKSLQSLIDVYPKGNVWYIDDEGYFSSLEQVAQCREKDLASQFSRRRSLHLADKARQRAEANLLSRVFARARQINFLPLWDVGGNCWHSGCFVWSQSTVPVFSVDSELAYISTFTNSVMAEISRLNAIAADKMTSDFISSISHEFRSPLHGILASAEFLRESELDPMQVEFVSTIQNCGSTLLDTINHVLDYSKINSFEKKSHDTGKSSNDLWQNTNVALMCENIVNGMMAANKFQGVMDSPQSIKQQDLLYHPVDIILDFEDRDWNYRIQSGALRRIVMNIFGNAQKYTESGFILVQLGVREAEGDKSHQRMLTLNVIDSGRGMSTEYMERKLYTPFAQEDAFAPGVGLGLSIVWNIVNQLGGKIHTRSERGKGTDVEVVLPLEDWEIGELSQQSDDGILSSTEAQNCVEALREIALGKTIAIHGQYPGQRNPRSSSGLAWQCMEKYCRSWFGFNTCSGYGERANFKVDLIIKQNTFGNYHAPDTPPTREAIRTLIIYGGSASPSGRRSREQNRSVQCIGGPIGPYKLARALLEIFRVQLENSFSGIDINAADAFSEESAQNSVSSTSLPPSREEVNIGPRPSIPGPIKAQSLEVPELASQSVQSHIPTSLGVAASPSLEQTLQDFAAFSYSSQAVLHEPVPGTTPAPSSDTHGTQTPLHLLAVDDNPLNLQLLHRYLLRRKLDTVIVARNGVEAFTAVREAKTSFDIIFMDISMPEMDGFEATRLIRKHERSIQYHEQVTEISKSDSSRRHAEIGSYEAATHPTDGNKEGRKTENAPEGNDAVIDETNAHHAYIVALTGLASRRDRNKADESGFDDYLTKPISFSKIGELLARLSAEKM